VRKLATAAIAFSAAVFLSHYLIPPSCYLICVLISAVAVLPALMVKGQLRTRLLIILLSLTIGFSAVHLSCQHKTLPAHAVSGSTLRIAARVTDYPALNENYATVDVDLIGENTPTLSARLYAFDNALDTLVPGNLISVDATLKSADERYGEAFGRYNAENMYLLCYVKGAVVVTGQSKLTFFYFLKTLAKNTKDMVSRVFPEDTAPLQIALLTGDASRLYADTPLYSAMSEAGILHVIAISGMNVAFIVGFINLLVRRKKLASLISLPLIWLFVPFAGATPSVVRAAFMVSTVLVAPLLKRENDGLTALTAILALLLLINPAACASVNLQLSFAAMLGMIFVSPKIYKPIDEALRTRFSKIKRKPNSVRATTRAVLTGAGAAFASTIGALVFTVPITALYFGYVSLIGVLVNVLVFWAVSVCFILGYVCCVLGAVWLPLGTLLAALTSLIVRYIMVIVELAAAVPYGAIYTRGNLFGYWVVLVYLVFLLCFVFKRKEGFRPVLPVCLSIMALCCVILSAERAASTDTGSLIAVDVGQGQSIVLTQGGATAIIDCGGKGKETNAGDTVAGLLLGSGRQSVDLLLLTHFDDDHVNGVTRLMSRIKVEYLVIPDGSYDKAWRQKILALAEEQGVEVYIISKDADFLADGLEIDVYKTFSQDEPSLIYLARIGSFEALVSGDAGISEEEEFIAAHALPDAELFVAGHHGSKNASSEDLLDALQAEYAVVSCGYNSYGHPTQEALSRFAGAGMQIFRTDQMGTITFQIS